MRGSHSQRTAFASRTQPVSVTKVPVMRFAF
jgi:hypothetical protein